MQLSADAKFCVVRGKSSLAHSARAEDVRSLEHCGQYALEERRD